MPLNAFEPPSVLDHVLRFQWLCGTELPRSKLKGIEYRGIAAWFPLVVTLIVVDSFAGLM